MASKCWFVLKQTHYPPPLFPKNGIGRVSGSGPLCLGHLIPDLRHLDNVINRHGPLDIPADMPMYPTKARNLTWETNRDSGADTSAGTGVPIATAAGLTVKLDAGVAFRQTTKNFWEFEALDTFIIQPTSEYIEDSVEDDEVTAYLDKRRMFQSSTVFMITGMIVARGAKTKTSELRKQDIHGNSGIGFPGVAEAEIKADVSNEEGVFSNAQIATDFVWAVRLAKISRGLIDRQWSHETLSSGATFGLDGDADVWPRTFHSLQSEGFEEIKKVPIGPDDDVFVLGAESGEV